MRPIVQISATVIIAVVASIVATKVAALQLELAIADQTEALRAIGDEQTEALESISDTIQIPPTNDRLFTILSQGVGLSEYQFNPNTATTTPEAAFITDLTSTQRTNATTQEFSIANNDATSTSMICWKGFAWGGGSCNATCSASGLTCTGGATATDGKRVAPGGELSRRFDGTSCICVVGNIIGGVAYQTERVVR
jgi:coenzyme F420-reducing hydrogenase gamma subunit